MGEPRLRTSRSRGEPGVPDVSTVPCPESPEGLPHDVRAGVPGPGRPATDPVWRCWICGAPWTRLDELIRTGEHQ